MKSLRAFWHWVDNERPSEVLQKHIEPLTDEEQRAVALSCELVLQRLAHELDYDRYALLDVDAVNAMHDWWPAVRDLSFVICSGIEVMCEDVPEGTYPDGESITIDRDNTVMTGVDLGAPGDKADVVVNATSDWLRPMPADEWHAMLQRAAALPRREDLSDWLPTQPPPDTFRGVDSGRYPGKLADAKPLRQVCSSDIEVQDSSMPAWYQRAINAQLANMPANTVLGRSAHTGPQTVQGTVRSNYDPEHRLLTIYTTLTVAELERLRGHSPVAIMLRGDPGQYDPSVFASMLYLVASMMADGAILTTPQSSPKAFGLG